MSMGSKMDTYVVKVLYWNKCLQEKSSAVDLYESNFSQISCGTCCKLFKNKRQKMPTQNASFL